MSRELAKTYDPKGIEDRLYDKWLEKKYVHAEVDDDPDAWDEGEDDETHDGCYSEERDAKDISVYRILIQMDNKHIKWSQSVIKKQCNNNF